MKRIVLSAALLVLGVSAASAYDGRGRHQGDGIDKRQTNQQQRINQGIRSGELTRQEALRLEAEQARIRELERLAKRDGRIDAYERTRLQQAQRQASRNIYEEKHDRQDRNRRWSGWSKWNTWR